MDTDFTFPACNVSAKNTISGLKECLIHHCGILHIIASDQGTYFTAKEVARGIRWSYHVPRLRKAASSVEQRKGLLKTQLQQQLGCNTFQVWGEVLQKTMCALNQYPTYGAVSPIASIHGSRDHGMETEVAPFTMTPSNPLAKVLLPSPRLYALLA